MASRKWNGKWMRKKSQLGRLAISISAAAKALGIGRNSAYEAAKRGDIPTIRIGGRVLVPIKALRRKIGDDSGGGHDD